MMIQPTSTDQWWKTATVYQIYPKSFCDTSGTGTGDLQGVISKLDYLAGLGIEVIWLTPVYPSPMVDNGYDICDYYDIHPEFGTLSDFERLLAEAHRRDIRVMMDIVVNHTSTAHPWFQDALGNLSSPYRDYYIWRPAKEGGVPNNWQSKFGGSAWEPDFNTGEYYLHLFAKEQADLNWENPHVREEVKKIISFWAEKGVDGFRLDVINLISKHQNFPDDDAGDGKRYYTDGPRVHAFLQEISTAVFQKYGCVTVGEMSSTTVEHCRRYSALDGKELSMVFNFHHLKVDYPNHEKWVNAPYDFIELKKIFNHWQTGLHDSGWGALFWCNHDQPRVVSRFGHESQYRVESAKMLAATLHMMQGTPYIYQGEEIGMTNAGYVSIEQYRDIESLNMYDILVHQQGMAEGEMLDILAQKSRDNARTPMQWNRELYAGFSRVKPWVDVAENYTEINVAAALRDPESIFYFYQQLIRLRKELDVITFGDYRDLYPDDKAIWGYIRQSERQSLICLSNFSERLQYCELPPDMISRPARYLLGNYTGLNMQHVETYQRLRPYETRIILLD
ncbi:trehalose-6-phosphate hydrolase [Vibrio gazogenes DSM 21264]|uniref:Alpha,alpha-phosphotrehalase n=3 Tax=Vibrio gazogenes TaxID=687 RepID=A0A1M5DHT5_VIBGA|nr:trehalose-6-phosphate hydrolase [Vibrio gazogenes DSM 21264] [Vibrio gazogenes DSM 21264 = NBRC 103151]